MMMIAKFKIKYKYFALDCANCGYEIGRHGGFGIGQTCRNIIARDRNSPYEVCNFYDCPKCKFHWQEDPVTLTNGVLHPSFYKMEEHYKISERVVSINIRNNFPLNSVIVEDVEFLGLEEEY